MDLHQGRSAWLLHLINQGQLAVEVFFILSGMLFYKSAVGAILMQPPSALRCARFVITRCLRLWPIMIFCTILLLPSPLVPNRASAAWTLMFASNNLPWNKQFLSWLWSDFRAFVRSHASHPQHRSISVDVQYFVFAVIAIFICSFAPSRAPSILTVVAATAAIASVAMSIQTAAELIDAPAASRLRVPMPVIGIDWMQVCPRQTHLLFTYFHITAHAGGRHAPRCRHILLVSVPQVSCACQMAPWPDRPQCCASLPALGHGASRRSRHP